MRYDIIGDIHGHSNDLIQLLKKMGYGLSEKNYYYHSDRQAIFVGDYIDRGKNSKEVVQIVRAMHENGSAIALMGNHEYNAICFHEEKSSGGYLRSHQIKNIKQHYATLLSFDSDVELKDAINWFKKLPLFFEDQNIRVVHACWESAQIEILKQKFGGNTLNPDLLVESATKGTTLNKAIDIILKGIEVPLKTGKFFKDKDGNLRSEIRIKWWENPNGKSFKDYAVNIEHELEDLNKIVSFNLPKTSVYSHEDKPVFFGHYWLKSKKPSLQTPNICCLDYSVAQNGNLVAYRFDGENELSGAKFCVV